jgi:predicted nuclease of restriction endonuclease-like (RecB) superfamily
MTTITIEQNYIHFLDDIKQRIAASRYKAALNVNRELITLYHTVGTQILKSQSTHGWGAKIIDQLSDDLKKTFPEMKGFSPRNLRYMRDFAQEYPDLSIWQEAPAKLPWYHHQTLLDRLSDPKARAFYMQQAIENGWSRNIMVMHIESGLHKRQGQAISNFKDKLPSPLSDLAHNTLKDPYIFDFLSIGDNAHEREMEYPHGTFFT